MTAVQEEDFVTGGTQYCCATCEFYDGWACSLSGKSKREETPACKCFELMRPEDVR
jgi:hypothetical protein